MQNCFSEKTFLLKDHFLKEQLTGMNINQKYKNKDETNISIA